MCVSEAVPQSECAVCGTGVLILEMCFPRARPHHCRARRVQNTWIGRDDTPQGARAPAALPYTDTGHRMPNMARMLRAARRPLPLACAASRGVALRTAPQRRAAKDMMSTRLAYMLYVERPRAAGRRPLHTASTAHNAPAAITRDRRGAHRRAPHVAATPRREGPRCAPCSRIRRTPTRRRRAEQVVHEKPSHQNCWRNWWPRKRGGGRRQ